MRLHRLLLLSALFALPAQAQDETPRSLPSLDAALPAEVRLLLASAAQGRSLFPVNGSEPFAGAVLKADVISFSANSELVLGATSAPFIVIAARDVKSQTRPRVIASGSRPPLLQMEPMARMGRPANPGRQAAVLSSHMFT